MHYGTRGEEGDIGSTLMNGHSHAEIVTLEAKCPLTQPVKCYVKITVLAFVLKLREREGLCV